MRGRQHDIGNLRIRGVAIGHRERHRGMGIDEIAGLAPGGADRGIGFGLIGAPGIKFLPDRGQHRVGQHETSGLFQRRHQPADDGRIPPIGLEQRAFEVRGHLNVHRRARRSVNLALLIVPVRSGAARMSFWLVAITSLSIGSPIRLAM